jgi:outer membrane protein assembly factor BamB
MARRQNYVSFFSSGKRSRRDFTGFEERVGPSRFILPGLVIAFLAVSVWWFAFRNAEETTGVVSLEDATVPTLLLPAGSEDEDPDLVSAGLSFECATEITDWSQFQGSPDRQGCTSVPEIVEPEIRWRIEVGVTGWLNNPVIANDTVFVGSAGVAQFQADRRDGIYAFDLDDGSQEWFVGTELDVNGVAYGRGIVVGTGDEGRVWGLSAHNGDLVWTDDLGSPTYGNPLVLDDLVVIGDGAGDVVGYDIRTGDRLWQRNVTSAVRGGAASDGEMIVVAGETGEFMAVDLDGNLLWRSDVGVNDPSGDTIRVFAAPTITDELVIVSLVREDTFAEPAILALRKRNGELVWRAQDAAGIKVDWGNVRSSPAVVGDLILYGEPYSESLVALDLATGETQWSAPAGSFCFPQWPSAAINGGQVILARHDGGVFGISLESNETVWRIYLGNLGANSTGAFPPGFDDTGFCDWGPEGAFSILSSPAVSEEGIVVVGTLEGILVALGDTSWE